MLVKADKFNKQIHFKGKKYFLSIHGLTIEEERKYDVVISSTGKEVGNVFMVYDPSTGNFILEENVGKNIDLKKELELQISDAIQNHHL